MSSQLSKSAKLSYHFGSVTTDSLHLLDKGNVTQGTSITSGVTLSNPVGTIQTVNPALAPQGNHQFIAQSSSIKSDSIIFASVGAYSGAGIPYINVVSFSAGACRLSLSNVSTTGTIGSSVTIAYQIL